MVGAGFTGLWTAYYLARVRPDWRIVVLEAQVAGFGASGRNGGWCSALFPVSAAALARMSGQDAALAQYRAMRETIDEVAGVVSAEGIDAQLTKGGTVVLARSEAQLARARAEVAEARLWDRGDVLLEPDAARAILNATRVVGATYTPDCAVVHPARLVRGLARAVERLGVQIFEQTPVTEIGPGLALTERGTVRARTVVRATEAYTSRLRGSRRILAPVYSLVIATEPLPAATWEEIGLARRETFTDHRHLIIYGQRTADDRLVFGGRGAPYHVGSRIRPEFDREPRIFARLWAALRDLLPVLHDTRVTHAWGGPLGIPRDWCPSVGLDRETGVAWAGGYVGDGVSTSNLAGRTLRDLILDEDTWLTRLPWVQHRSPSWEPEPLRWLGINAGLRAARLADLEEALTGRPSVVGRVLPH